MQLRKLYPKLMRGGAGLHDPYWSALGMYVMNVVNDYSVESAVDNLERDVRYFVFRVRRATEMTVSARRGI